MSDGSKEKVVAGRLIGKTTTHTLQLLITNPEVGRNSFFVLYDGGEDKKPYIAGIINMWSDKQGLMAEIQIIGERPMRPFDMGSEVYLASEEQIKDILGIQNPPEKSVYLGNLIGYSINVYLLVKNFGRIFITGKSGSGKSYTMGVLCEEFLKKGIPVVIVDRHGEYSSLKVASEELIEEEDINQYCPWCGAEIKGDIKYCDNCNKKLDLSSEIPHAPDISENSGVSQEDIGQIVPKSFKKGGKESEFIDKIIEFADLNANKGADIDIEYLFSLDVSDIVAPNLCTIINLRGLPLEVQEIIMGRLLKLLYQASVSRKIPPFYLFLDEAHLFAGKKRTETCETVKLFSQEGRKFGANLVLGTQRPQLLDTTIRAQAGTWIIHQLSDVNDIKITIQSAEDLSSQNKADIQGLDKGEAIICGEAVGGVPLFVKVRKRRTKHGGTGFNPLDFLPEQTVEELKKRKERILANKSQEDLEKGKTEFQEITKPKTISEYQQEVANLKSQIKVLEDTIEEWKKRYAELESKTSSEGNVIITGDNAINEKIKELEIEVKVWKERYNALKNKQEQESAQISNTPELIQDSSEKIEYLESRISDLESEISKWKKMYENARDLAARSIAELKKYEK
ncbi:MAG: helicase HerA domain-containing protein [Promethearchaeota archaeon]